MLLVLNTILKIRLRESAADGTHAKISGHVTEVCVGTFASLIHKRMIFYYCGRNDYVTS